MPLKILLDENFRHSALWAAIEKHNLAEADRIDVVRVGDGGPPLSTSDSEILVWAEEHGRILVSRDVSTLPRHLNLHLAKGRHSPGIVFFSGDDLNYDEIVEYFVLMCHSSEPCEYADACKFVP